MNRKQAEQEIVPVVPQSDLKQSRRLQFIAAHHPERLRLFERIYDGKASLRQCIKAFCLECNSWNEAAIEHCGITRCPLWNQRPFQRGNAPPSAQESTNAAQPLPPILSATEFAAQLEQKEAQGHPGHFLPSEDGIE